MRSPSDELAHTSTSGAPAVSPGSASTSLTPPYRLSPSGTQPVPPRSQRHTPPSAEPPYTCAPSGESTAHIMRPAWFWLPTSVQEFVDRNAIPLEARELRRSISTSPLSRSMAFQSMSGAVRCNSAYQRLRALLLAASVPSPRRCSVGAGSERAAISGAIRSRLSSDSSEVTGSGAQAAASAWPRLRFRGSRAHRTRRTPTLSDAEVAELVEQLARRVTRYLQRKGRLPRAHAPIDADQPAEREASLFGQLCAASIQGGAALAPESSPPLARLGQRRPPRPPPLPGSLCADHGGFSLHAKVLVPAGELERLEHLCRYVTRPPIATQRLVLSPDGRVVYGLKRHWRDGTSAVCFDPLTFIERLAARILFATTPRRRCDSSLR
ncbi:MAG: hypothetical protein FJ294_14740, partial [Planctomycetes bacterium]|nr:hypothetical protein [Planctomycetota bacterium]